MHSIFSSSGQTMETLNDLDAAATAPSEAGWESVAERWAGLKKIDLPFVAVPMDLLRHQGDLGLSSSDLVLIVNLAAHRWKSGQVVYPSNATLAKRTGMSEQTIQRILKRLQDAGLLRRVRHPEGGRAFDLSPLVERLRNVMNS